MGAFENLKQANDEDHVVLGLKSVSDVLPRQDIDILCRDDPDVLNLFILALAALQHESMTNKWMGYFQIAAIHGLPKRYWDGVEAANKKSTSVAKSGYCAHGVETFPTWHRPYLAMMEQTLYLKMVEIANEYDVPHKGRYRAAADRFRLPFWDYFRPRGGPVTFPGVIDNALTSYPYDYSAPILLTESKIMVRQVPDDELVLKSNPLCQFKFGSGLLKADWETKNQNVSDMRYFPRDATARYPVSSESPGFEGSGSKIQNIILNSLRMDTNRVALHMMGDPAYDDYDTFACTRLHRHLPFPSETDGKKGEQAHEIWDAASGSLEALHGLYHGLIGGFNIKGIQTGGHMTEVPVAAFDPIFWMHHCQIDRLFAIWQSIRKDNPKSWFSNERKAGNDLLPFRNAAGKSYWNSNLSKETEDFGYTYPEIKDTKDATRETFKNMYQWSVPLLESDIGAIPPDDMLPYDVRKSQFFNFKGEEQVKASPPLLSEVVDFSKEPLLLERVEALQKAVPSKPPTKDYSREWYIDDKVQRLALNGAFTIFYFISRYEDGRAPSSLDRYVISPSLAAITHIFAAPTELCDNCGRQDEQASVVTNTSAITSFLIDYIKKQDLKDLEPDNVLPFLEQRLKWRVLKSNGDLEDPRAMKDTKEFKISISCKKAALPRDSGDVQYETYPEVFERIIQRASAAAESIQG